MLPFFLYMSKLHEGDDTIQLPPISEVNRTVTSTLTPEMDKSLNTSFMEMLGSFTDQYGYPLFLYAPVANTCLL